MICITGMEKTTAELLERLTRCASFPLQEIRIDALKEPLPAKEALPVPPDRLVVACRRVLDGGRFDGSEKDRYRRLEKSLAWNPAWLDLELDLPREVEQHLLPLARARGTRVLRSVHQMTPAEPGDITKGLALLSRANGEGIKLAVQVDDVIRLEEFLVAPTIRTAVLIGMGQAGQLSRVLSRRFKSAWTYVSASDWSDLNTGIPDLATAQRYGMPVSQEAPFFALLGGPSILQSPGPVVYNTLFRQKAYEGVYLLGITDEVESAFSFLCRLGLTGASVTVPHKMAAMQLAHQLGKAAASSGALNTLWLTRGGDWMGENTDIPAIQALVKERAAGRPLRKGLVLGTGGFARACAYALSDLKIDVTLMGRRVLLERGPWAASWPLGEIAKADFDILINATPVGSRPDDESLVTDKVVLKDKIVIDGVLSAKPTALVRQAAARGGRVAGGVELWAQQGTRQLRLLGAPEASAEELAAMAAELARLHSGDPLMGEKE